MLVLFHKLLGSRAQKLGSKRCPRGFQTIKPCTRTNSLKSLRNLENEEIIEDSYLRITS